MDFHETSYWWVLLKYVDLFQFWLTPLKKGRPLHENAHACDWVGNPQVTLVTMLKLVPSVSTVTLVTMLRLVPSVSTVTLTAVITIQADRRRLIIAEARVRFYDSPCENRGWQPGTGTGFLQIFDFNLSVSLHHCSIFSHVFIIC
jgi:hypothetical protein